MTAANMHLAVFRQFSPHDRSLSSNDLAHADGCFDQLHTNGHKIKVYISLSVIYVPFHCSSAAV